MRRHRHLALCLCALLITAWGCSKSDQSDKSDSSAQTASAAVQSVDIPDIAIKPGAGAIYMITGPHSPEVVSKGFYHMRRQFPLEPFPLGLHQYALMDSIANYEVVGYAEFNGFEKAVDSVGPGMYTLLVYVSRLSKAAVKHDTTVTESGDTIITDPVKGMSPYEYYFRPILVDSIRVEPGVVSVVDVSKALEAWRQPQQTETGWEAPRAHYLAWDRRLGK